MIPLDYDRFDTPIGPLTVASDGEGRLRHILFADNRYLPASRPDWRHAPTACSIATARQQLLAYLHGERFQFELPLAPVGTPFQLQVWHSLARIPYGSTWSYAELARRIGRAGASRAVGAANGRNPLPIVLPCHRVVGSNGALVGFGGGLPVKQALLQMERGANGDREAARLHAV